MEKTPFLSTTLFALGKTTSLDMDQAMRKIIKNKISNTTLDPAQTCKSLGQISQISAGV